MGGEARHSYLRDSLAIHLMPARIPGGDVSRLSSQSRPLSELPISFDESLDPPTDCS